MAAKIPFPFPFPFPSPPPFPFPPFFPPSPPTFPPFPPFPLNPSPPIVCALREPCNAKRENKLAQKEKTNGKEGGCLRTNDYPSKVAWSVSLSTSKSPLPKNGATASWEAPYTDIASCLARPSARASKRVSPRTTIKRAHIAYGALKSPPPPFRSRISVAQAPPRFFRRQRSWPFFNGAPYLFSARFRLKPE